MILLINAVPIATVLKEIYIKYRFKMGAKTKVLQIVNKLVNSGFLRKQGIGRGTTYMVK